jgi:heme-degrading monooxygenase HmoA
MFVVVFELHPAAGKKDEYLALARRLKPILESIDGFIDNERFESKRREGWMLSLSTWRDEKAVVRWRSQGEHHRMQEKGRNGIFSDYHLRVCEVTSDSRPPAGLQVIERRLDPTEVGEGKALTITEASPAPNASCAAHPDSILGPVAFYVHAEGLVGYDVFESIYNPGKTVLLASWKTAEDSARWMPGSFADVAALRHRRIRNVRDYGMFDRREAAQYFPVVRPPNAGPPNAGPPAGG